jgi:hypothetical protein
VLLINLPRHRPSTEPVSVNPSGRRAEADCGPPYGGWQQVGGTSVSTPIWAGYLSIIDGAREIVGLGRFGLINPDLYFLAFTQPGLIDTRDGSNGDAALYGGIPGFNAGPGYDACTGWGSMLGELFAANSLVVHLTTIGNAPPPPTGFSGTVGKTTADLKWTKTPRAKGYLIEVTQPDSTAVTFYVAKGTSVQLTALTPKTTYVASLFPVNKTGTTLVPNTIYITTQ